MNKSRSILQELNQIAADRDRDLVIQNRGEHVIESAINLLEQIRKTYDEDVAKDLSNRMINSIRAADASKFRRGIRKAIKEQQQKNT